MKRILTIVLALMFCLVMAIPALAQNSIGSDKVAMKKVFIGFDRSPGMAEQALVHQKGGIIKYTYNIVPVIAANVPEAAIKGLLQNPHVLYVESVGTISIMGKPTSPPGKDKRDKETPPEILPWGIDRIDADLVWDIDGNLTCDEGANTGAGVKVAIIDTGIDYTHPDLKANYVDGYNFVKNNDNPMDDNGHGTHCAGIVVAVDNEVGVIGVAPDASLYALKVMDRRGSGTWDDVIAALEWCVGNEMQVASMSFGGGYQQTVEDACYAAYESGIVLVAAAGNHQFFWQSSVVYPAKYDSVIAVSATDSEDNVPSWSNYGPEVELAAPGVDIFSTWKNGGYETVSGTSMACPHVSGTVALVLASGRVSNNGGLYGVANEVRDLLAETADDKGTFGKDIYYGYGIVDAEEAATGTQTE